jgi:hypothetical protein
MATYTTPLRIKLLADGEEPGVWGQSTNTNLSTVLESAITGVKTLSPGDVNYTLTALNALADDARNAVLVFTGARTAIRTITAPNVNKTYIITNSTTGGFGITISAGAGATITIPNGATAIVYCDGSTGFYLVHSTIPIANTAMNSTKLIGLTAGTTTGDSVEYNQFNTAIGAVPSKADLQSQAYTAFTTTGTSTAYVATPSPAIATPAANARLRLKFHLASGATPTLTVGTVTAALQQYDATGTLIAATIGLNQLTDVEYNGTVYIVLEPIMSTAGDLRYAKLAGLSSQLFAVASGVSGNNAVNFSQFPVSLAANGSQTLPGGLIIKWGSAGGHVYATPKANTFPVAFPTGVLAAVISSSTTPSGAQGRDYISALTTTTITIGNADPNTATFYWIVLGY